MAMHRFQTMGELRALLAGYNIGMEEVVGERKGVQYHDLLYTAFETVDGKTEVTPLKSSLTEKEYGYVAQVRCMERSGDELKKDGSAEHTRHECVRPCWMLRPRASFANACGLTSSTCSCAPTPPDALSRLHLVANNLCEFRLFSVGDCHIYRR